MEFEFFGKFLIFIGIAIIICGILLYLLPKIPFLGRLPGDIIIQKKNFTFYFPLATCLVLSLIISFIFTLFTKK